MNIFDMQIQQGRLLPHNRVEKLGSESSCRWENSAKADGVDERRPTVQEKLGQEISERR